MGYVAVKGGQEAITEAAKMLRYLRLKGGSRPLEVRQIQEQLRLAVDKVMSEGSLYAPFHAALALKQAEGDTMEAAFILRAYRSTQPRSYISLPADTRHMRILRRISAAFKDIPGGQFLGPSRDYTQRLLDFTLAEEGEREMAEFLEQYLQGLHIPAEVPSFPKVIDLLRREGLLAEVEAVKPEPPDITREPLTFPAPRQAALQVLARGETGGLLALAYSNMKGYGDIHPTIGELRVGYLPLRLQDSWGREVYVGQVLVTEAEVIARLDTPGGKGKPQFTLGYGLCFGHNELKAISMAVLDRAMQSARPQVPSEDQEFVLSIVDGIESSGFAAHYKLPHYITFQSDLDRLRAARRWKGVEIE
ncbi:MAG: alpha-D-ribose 1-methylphosphonate 5-triphosphate synthase subunit PhnI [Moorella sp. (in: firmicutes)]|nr:alpha-D-ribose 1-methylphosphonate 5-triphosphate synthase subunit PhnI [Moorella sp. (in: firmicutes)]MDK2895201.1 alpha-D-ribose 1-methylphosphonate 5-triphosphate synthase subunit PhnI [Moorella sp. (in: firmicutes)]